MKKLFGITALTALICMQALYGVSAAGAETMSGKELFTSVCAGCHKADGSGGPAPKLKGQSAADLTAKLQGYKAGTYGGAKKGTMQNVLKNRTPEDIKAVVDYIGTL